MGRVESRLQQILWQRGIASLCLPFIRRITQRHPQEAFLRQRATLQTRLEQILVNLLGNTKDAMPEGGNVTIRLAAAQGPDGPIILLEVKDDGPGLPPIVMDHLFEPFITTKGEGKGTGLGLSTVRALVVGDGGAVSVRSSPSAGCLFLITYPMANIASEVGSYPGYSRTTSN